MTKNEIKNAVIVQLLTIAPEARPEEIRPDAPIREQLDIDSFDFLNFVTGIHGALGIDVPEADYAQLSTVDRAVDYLARRGAAQASGPRGLQ